MKKKSPQAEIWKPRAEIRKLRTEMSKQTTIRKRKKRIRVDWTQIRNRKGTQAFFKHTMRVAPPPQQQSPEEKEELPGKGVNMLVAQLVDGWTLNNPCPLADRASSPRTSMDNRTKAYWFHLQRWGGSNIQGGRVLATDELGLELKLYHLLKQCWAIIFSILSPLFVICDWIDGWIHTHTHTPQTHTTKTTIVLVWVWVPLKSRASEKGVWTGNFMEGEVKDRRLKPERTWAHASILYWDTCCCAQSELNLATTLRTTEKLLELSVQRQGEAFLHRLLPLCLRAAPEEH